MSGRYTAYHVYPELSLYHASRSCTESPRTAAYRCPQGQVGMGSQYDAFQQRAHYAHSTNSCCGERVLNFESQPQFNTASEGVKPKFCGKLKGLDKPPCVGIGRSEVPRVWCGSGYGIADKFVVHCPEYCEQLRQIEQTGSFRGLYGVFYFQGRINHDDIVLGYHVDRWLMDDIFQNCRGTYSYREPLCNTMDIQFDISAAMNYPDGCGCDCCGEYGNFGPTIGMDGLTPDATWDNAINIPGEVTVDESCEDGTITGTVAWTVGGSESVPWTTAPYFDTDGTSMRVVTGSPGTVGSGAKPACCGGTITYTGTDGCGNSMDIERTIDPKISAGPTVQGGLSGYVLRPATEYTISGLDACAYSDLAALTFQNKTCIDTTEGSVTPHAGYIDRTMDASLQASGGCDACCGNGSFDAYFHNGCSGELTQGYTVRKAYTDGTTKVGWLLYPKDLGSDQYEVWKRTFNCDGSENTDDVVAISGSTDLATCLAKIDAYNDTDIPTLCDNPGTITTCTTCCRYCNNGASGVDFRAAIFCVGSHATCCTLPFEDPAGCGWVRGTKTTPCCPYED